MKHLVWRGRATKDYECYEKCGEPIFSGSLHSLESIHLEFTSGKSFSQIRRRHDSCFLRFYYFGNFKTHRNRKSSATQWSRINRRNYIVRKILDLGDPEIWDEKDLRLAFRLSTEYIALNQELGGPPSPKKAVKRSEEARERLRISVNYAIQEGTKLNDLVS